VELTGTTEERMPSEQKWYALTGRVVAAKVEADGDIHIALQDATATAWELLAPKSRLARSGVRFGKLCFAGRHRSFHSRSRRCTRLKLAPRTSSPFRGKAFYDIAHAPADHSNRRHSPKDYAVWEIHPVMKMGVVQ